MTTNLNQWYRGFLAEAKADNYNEILRHIDYLDLDCTPEDMVEDTAMLLSAVIAYCQIDGRGWKSIIKQQKYRLGGEGLSFYCLTFKFGRGKYGRILTNEKIDLVDFADLFNHPWDKYKIAGFQQVWISRLDGKPINDVELETLYRLVTEDMYFDYTEDEVVVDVFLTEHNDTALATAVEYMKRPKRLSNMEDNNNADRNMES